MGIDRGMYFVHIRVLTIYPLHRISKILFSEKKNYSINYNNIKKKKRIMKFFSMLSAFLFSKNKTHGNIC